MRKSTKILGYIACITILAHIISCGIKTSKSREREEIIKEIESYQSSLPYLIPGTSISITNISIDNDIIIYTVIIGKEDWSDLSLTSDIAGTDRNLARTISNVSRTAVDKFIEHNLGLKYVYTSSETGDILWEIEISAKKLKEIRDKVDSGELQAYTIIELFNMELAKMDIPSQIDEGVWLADAYTDGNKLYFIATVEDEIDSSAFSNFELGEMKKSLIEEIRDGFISVHKKELSKENIHIIYIYKDRRGKEFARFDIAPHDLWDIQDLI